VPSTSPYSVSPSHPNRKKRSFSNTDIAKHMSKQIIPDRDLDVNEIMSRVPPVTELSPHVWLTVYQAGHHQTMQNIVALADALGHESLRAKCPLYLILKRNLASLGEIDAWWREISGYQKQMCPDFESFQVLDCPYVEKRQWLVFASSEPDIPDGNDVEVLIKYLVDILKDLKMLHAQNVTEQAQNAAVNDVRSRIAAAAAASDSNT